VVSLGFVQVKIGSVRLGKREQIEKGGSPWERKRSEAPAKPNPIDITWEQRYGIAIHEPVGRKPITQVTGPKALWTCTMQFNVTNEDSMAEVRDLTVGPHIVRTSLDSLCMYLERKRMTQPGGTNDFYYNCTLSFIEANDRGTS